MPADLPGAVRLFARCGWQAGQDTLDLVADLPGYRASALAAGGSVPAGITIMLAAPDDVPAVMAFETATFPNWVRWFQAGNRDILLARDDAGAICATLLLDGPDADTVFEPMLGPAAATINCVGVAPPHARTRHRHRPGGTRVGDTSRPRRRHLPHQLDRPRVVLHPRGIPALAAIPHVPHEHRPSLGFDASRTAFR